MQCVDGGENRLWGPSQHCGVAEAQMLLLSSGKVTLSSDHAPPRKQE